MRTYLLITFVLLIALPDSGQAETSVFNLPISASVPAGSPRLEAGPDGEVFLSWLSEAADDQTTLQFARYDNGEWSATEIVTTEAEMFVNWADLPSVVPLGDGRIGAHWLQMAGGSWHSYHVMFLQSLDDGETWSPSIRAHYDSSQTEHGFVSMYPVGDRIGAIWLDGRKMAEHDGSVSYDHGMTLRSRTFGAELDTADQQEVDGLICDCCTTDVAVASSGPIVIYRDRSEEEIRDIAVSRHIDGEWQPPTRLADDGWEIDGCPVNGPSIVADGDQVAAAWFTGANSPLVQLAISNDSGETFGDPIAVIDGGTRGRVSVASLDEGFAVSWLAPNPEAMSVQMRLVTEDGTVGPIQTVTDNAAGMAYPQMVRSGDDLIFAWTENDEAGTRIASARLDIAGLKP